MPPELDADMLATLTDEERAAITAGEYSHQELEAMQRLADKDAGIANDDSDDDGDDGDGDDTPGDGGAGTGESASETVAPAAKDAAADKPAATAAVVDDAPAPRYEAKLPDDFGARVEALATKENDAWAKFEAGELSRDQLQSELQAVSSERNELSAAKIKAEISQEMNQQTAAQQWQSTVARNLNEFAKPENGGIDYRNDPAKSEDLDQFVKFLANKSENADKPMDWFLKEAHKRVQALHGVAPATRKDEVIADAKNKRKADPSAAPATLAQVPGGDGPGDVAGEFAHLDALDGNDLEAAIAKMTPAQREKYSMGL